MSPTSFVRRTQLLWAAFVTGVVAIAAVGTVLAGPGADVPEALPAALAVTIGAATIVGVVAIQRLFAAEPPPDDAAALTGYRVRLVLQAALAEAGTLLSVALAIVVGPAWVAAVGGAGALLALLQARPSAHRLAQLDAAWAARGSDVSLRRAAAATERP